MEDFIKQHHFLSEIFDDSVNTLRILTLKNEEKPVVIKAHKLFPTLKIIGWDIAITEKGPCVVEGNRIPDFFNVTDFQTFKKSSIAHIKNITSASFYWGVYKRFLQGQISRKGV